jgi:DNA-binding GntR family transcriptional regulator
MRQLRTEGLIESEAHQAAVVRGMSLEHIAELYVYRALLEGYITERATPNITPGQLAELRAMNMAMRGRDHRDWLQRDVAFHHEILRASGAKTGLELVGQLRSRVERYVHMWAGEEGMHLPAEAGTEHAEILDRIGEGDAAGARRAVEQHIRNRGQRLVAYGAVARAMRGGEA